MSSGFKRSSGAASARRSLTNAVRSLTQRIGGRGLFAAIRHDQQDRQAADAPRQRADEFDRRRAGPVKVLQDDAQRPHPPELLQDARDRFEEALAGTVRRKVSVRNPSRKLRISGRTCASAASQAASIRACATSASAARNATRTD